MGVVLQPPKLSKKGYDRMKKIISLLLLISMIFSMSVISYSEDTSVVEDLKLVSSYVSSRYSIYLEFNEAVLFDDALKESTFLTINGETDENGAPKAVEYTYSNENEGKTLVLKPTVALDIEKEYTVTIPLIYNTDKTKILFNTKADISFDIQWNDDFESYDETADLDSNYIRAYGDSAGYDAFTNLTSSGLETVDGNKKMKIANTGTAGVWINKDGWKGYGHGKKYYTLEADFSVIKTHSSTMFMRYNTAYMYSLQTMWFYTSYVSVQKNRLFTENPLKDVPYSSNWNSYNNMTLAISTYKKASSDSFDVFWNGKNLYHNEGTLTAANEGDSVYGIMSTYGDTAFYIDNLKIYRSEVTYSSENSYTGAIPTELSLIGKLEADTAVSVDIADETDTDVLSEYFWYKGTDADKLLENPQENGELIAGASAKTYTVKDEDITDENGLPYYLVCRVKRTLKISESENYELFDIVTYPLAKAFAPECRNLSFTYTINEDYTSASLAANYEYYDSNRDEQKGTVITWEISDDNGTWQQLSVTTDFTDSTDENGKTISTATLDVTGKIETYIRCTVKVKNEDPEEGANAEAVTKEYTLPFKPIVKAVSISGTASVGSLLQADYDYFDENGDEDKGSEFVWYKKSGTTETVVSEDSLAYVVQSSDRGYSIGFKVIPKNEAYPQSTTEYKSNEIAIPAAVVIPSYSGNSSVSGGSYTATVKPATKDDESKDNEKVLEALKESTKPAFADIENHWAENEISSLSEKGIVKGRENGFEPDAMITRAEWITLLLRGIEEETELKYKGIFADVKEGEWYTQTVEKAYSLGLVSGDGENFNPNDKVTREQMAKMAVLVYEYKNGEIKDSKDIDFIDKDNMSDWAEEYIKKAVSAELMNGVTESEFSFSSSATRAQACVLLSRIINSLK